MNFQVLHELLRRELVRRIDDGELTGTRIAQQAGFQQAHISNFLNRKRSLSLEGLDRVMAAQGLTIEDILPLQVNAAGRSPGEHRLDNESEDAVAMVPLVSMSVASEESRIRPASIVEVIPITASRLSDQRERPSRRVVGWERFVAVRCDSQQALAMDPLLAIGSVAVIDRHYNSLAPYHSDQPTLLAIRYGAGLLLRYAEFDDARLILRPASLVCAVQLLAIADERMPADYVVGRVCMIFHGV
jgi:transcriptional regulator with XRE-family HTH domain